MSGRPILMYMAALAAGLVGGPVITAWLAWLSFGWQGSLAAVAVYAVSTGVSLGLSRVGDRQRELAALARIP